MVELRRPLDHLHCPATEHVRRAEEHRIADALGDGERLIAAAGDAVGGLQQVQLADQPGKPLAVLGQIDAVRRSAEDRHTRCLQPGGELQRRSARPIGR
jgi:hypothetical protein